MVDVLGPANAPNSVTSRPLEDRSFGPDDTWFKDCSSPAANDGTKLRSSFMNGWLANQRALLRGNGNTGAALPVVAEDNSDVMLLRSVQNLIQRGQVLFGRDTGTLNAVVVTLSPAPAEYKAGMTIRVLMANVPTGPCVINCNGLGNMPITLGAGLALRGNEWSVGQIVEMTCDGTQFQCIGLVARQPLMANTTLYVNGATGNDSTYDGSAAAVSGTHGPFKTIGRAMLYAAAFGPSAYSITINVAAGTYPEGVSTPSYAIPFVIINGVPGSPSSVVVTGAANTHTFLAIGPNLMTVQNLTSIGHPTGASNSCFIAGTGATLYTQNTITGAANFSIFEAIGPATMVPGNNTFTGNCAQCFAALNGGYLPLGNNVGNFVIGNAISVTAFASAFSGGNIAMTAGFQPSFTNPGNVSGLKYSASGNGVINTAGMGESYFPGTAAGVKATGGQYI